MQNGIPNFKANSSEEKTDKPKFRPELGAIWQRKSKNDSTFFTMKLKLGLDKLKELLKNSEENNSDIEINLVAFAAKKENPKQPDYRIFESETKV